MSSRVLGKGIDKLFHNGSLNLNDSQEGSSELPLSKIVPNAHQPRQTFDEASIDELATSIKAQGVIQPLIVRPSSDGMYEIVAGERRWRAAQKAGLRTVPVVIRKLSDAEAMTAALIENIQREELNPLEEARAIATLRDTLGISQEDLSTRIGKSRSAIANALRLLQLPENVLLALQNGSISAGHARALLAISDEALRITLFDMIQSKGLSVRDVENATSYIKEHGALPPSMTESKAVARVHAPRAKKTPVIREAQQRLRRAIHPKATIAGDTNMGRITIPYDSEDAFLHILKCLSK